jgi:multidrug resistance efflux pump
MPSCAVLRGSCDRRRLKEQGAVSAEELETHETIAVVTQAQYQQALANREQARVNLERTQIRSPVHGWVTNLAVRLGDYAIVGKSNISATRSAKATLPKSS